MSRTRTLASTACMSLTNALPYPLFHLIERVSDLLLLREQRLVDVLGGILATAPHHDLIAFFVPFQDGTWTDAEFPANLGRNGNLSLRGNLGVRQCHSSHHGNGRESNRCTGISRLVSTLPKCLTNCSSLRKPANNSELFRMNCAGTSGIVSTGCNRSLPETSKSLRDHEAIIGCGSVGTESCSG